MSPLAASTCDEYTSRTVWKYGGWGEDADWPGIVGSCVVMLGVYAASQNRKARRALFSTLAEVRYRLSGRDQVAGSGRAVLLLLLDALRAAAPAACPDTTTRTVRPPRDVTRQITPARGAPVLAGALAGGCAPGRAPT